MTPRILIVEDDIRAAIATQQALARAGFLDVSTVCAHDPNSAAFQATHHILMVGAGVIITDGLMGHCRDVIGYLNTSSIIYTGTPDRYTGKFGAVPVVSKPDAAAMVAAVRRILGIEEGA